MQRKLLIMPLVLSSLLVSCGGTSLAEIKKVTYPSNDKTKVNISTEDRQAYNDFAARSTENVFSGEDNQIYSPASLYMALNMVKEGTDNNTLTELNSCLYGSHDPYNISKALYETNYYDNEWGKGRIADSYWVRNGLDLLDSYTDTLKNDYYAEGYLCDFDSTATEKMVKWVNSNTFDFLNLTKDDLGDLSEAMMVLINTIYFENKWSTEFRKDNIKTKPFLLDDGTTQDVSFMTHTVTGQYLDLENYDAAIDYFYNGNTITYIRPKTEDFSLGEAIYQASSMDYDSAEVTFHVPEFKYQKNMDLIPMLRKMGVNDLFDASYADLSKTSTTSLYVSDLKQIAGIELSPEGVKAAAVTEVVEKCTAEAPTEIKQIDFNLNQPFYYFISDANNTILFTGKVTDPTK